MLHNPFKIFPTHRLIRVPKGRKMDGALEKIGAIQKVKDLKAVLSRLDGYREDTPDKGYTFGFYCAPARGRSAFGGKSGLSIIKLNKKTAASVKKNPVDKLDVAVLHKKILEPCFGIRAVEKSDAIDFTRDAQEAVQKVKSGQFDLAIFLRPTSLREMLYVSKKGLKMPQKSTYFYPKLLTGLVFHGLES